MTSYRGALLTRDQAAEASRRHGSSYLFALGDVYLDATESCHARHHRPVEVPSRRSLRGNCCGTSDRPLASLTTRRRATSSPRRP